MTRIHFAIRGRKENFANANLPIIHATLIFSIFPRIHGKIEYNEICIFLTPGTKEYTHSCITGDVTTLRQWTQTMSTVIAIICGSHKKLP